MTIDLKIGADPEFFVQDRETGKLVSAYGLIEGTKKNPIPMGSGHAQVDGMALEINVKPATSAEEFVENVHSVIDELQKTLPRYKFIYEPVANFGKKLIDAQPEEAKALGCEPDFNAYNGGKPNPIPDAEVPFRTASGHFHIGWTEGQDPTHPEHIEACHMVVKQLEPSAGIINAFLEGLNGKTRRRLYGKSGCYRPKHYGVEWRTPSNTWLQSDAEMALMFNVIFDEVTRLQQDGRVHDNSRYSEYIDLGYAINLYDWRYARAFEDIYQDILALKKDKEKAASLLNKKEVANKKKVKTLNNIVNKFDAPIGQRIPKKKVIDVEGDPWNLDFGNQWVGNQAVVNLDARVRGLAIQGGKVEFDRAQIIPLDPWDNIEDELNDLVEDDFR